MAAHDTPRSPRYVAMKISNGECCKVQFTKHSHHVTHNSRALWGSEKVLLCLALRRVTSIYRTSTILPPALPKVDTMPSSQSSPGLTAHYTFPTNSSDQTWSYPQSSIASAPSTDERVAYLAKLRKDLAAMQTEVNHFLTEKMEEDKRSAAVNGGGDVADRVSGKGQVDEKVEEDNYGEEGEEG